MMKIGVIGAGRIVKLFLSAVDMVESVTCTAICTREKSMERASRLAQAHKIPGVYNDPDAFLQDDFDWVYIGVENVMHYEYAQMALLHGKHVIVEKPICGTYRQTEALYRMAKEGKRFLFEAMMVTYLPLYKVLKEQLTRLVDVKSVLCNFSKVSSAYEAYCNGEPGRFFNKEAYGGAVYDLNIYNICAVTGLWGRPEEIQYFANYGYNGVDTSGILLMKYPDFAASCTASKDSGGVDFFQIQARNGYIYIEGSVASLSKMTVCVDGETVVYEETDDHARRMAFEVEAMRDLWESQDLEGCYSIMEHTLCEIQVAEDALLKN